MNITQAAAELCTYFPSVAMFNKFGAKKTLWVSYTIALIGMCGFIIYQGDNTGILLGMIIFAKFGITSAYNMCYIVTNDLFSVEAYVFVMGNA